MSKLKMPAKEANFKICVVGAKQNNGSLLNDTPTQIMLSIIDEKLRVCHVCTGGTDPTGLIPQKYPCQQKKIQ